jgi:hypothetical protein
VHQFSIGEIMGPLDQHYTDVVIRMITAYGEYGETAELREAGKWVYENFPRLIELSNAMSEARSAVRQKWDDEAEAERRRLYPEEYS